TVQREFTNDRYAARTTVAGMFDRIDPKRREVIDKFREEKLGNDSAVLVWNRGSSRSPGGGNPGLDMNVDVLGQLFELVRSEFSGRTAFVVGDPVFDAGEELRGLLDQHNLVEYW